MQPLVALKFSMWPSAEKVCPPAFTELNAGFEWHNKFFKLCPPNLSSVHLSLRPSRERNNPALMIKHDHVLG